MASFRTAGASHSERKPTIRDLGTFTEPFERLDSNTLARLRTNLLFTVKASAYVPLSSDGFDRYPQTCACRTCVSRVLLPPACAVIPSPCWAKCANTSLRFPDLRVRPCSGSPTMMEAFIGGRHREWLTNLVQARTPGVPPLSRNDKNQCSFVPEEFS